jgi:hypothetical protein
LGSIQEIGEALKKSEKKGSSRKSEDDDDEDDADISKVEFLRRLASELPDGIKDFKVIAMGDRWFTGEDAIKALLSKGCQYAGAMRLNRSIRPDPARMELLAGSCARIIKREQCGLAEAMAQSTLSTNTRAPPGIQRGQGSALLAGGPLWGGGQGKGVPLNRCGARCGRKPQPMRQALDYRGLLQKHEGNRLGKHQIRHIESIGNLLWVYALLQCICVECPGDPHAFNEGFELPPTEAGLAELREMFDFARCSGFDEFCSLYRQ